MQTKKLLQKFLSRLVTLFALFHSSNAIPPMNHGAVFSGPYATRLTMHRVAEVLQRARGMSHLQRMQNYHGNRNTHGMSSQCLLALHHGYYKWGVIRDYTKATDILRALRILMHEDGYSPEYLQTDEAMSILGSVQGFECDLPDPGLCDFTSPYRTQDGSCNNIFNPRWGMAGMIQRRILHSNYDDIFGLPRRRGLHNIPLPNPRHVSNTVNYNPRTAARLSSTRDCSCGNVNFMNDKFNTRIPRDYLPGNCVPNHCMGGKHLAVPFYIYGNMFSSPRKGGINKGPLPNLRHNSNTFLSSEEELIDTNTLYVFAMGQFIDHDIAMSPESEVSDCCQNDNDVDCCFNIHVTDRDIFSNILVPGHCMEVKRSSALFCSDATSNFRPRRQQINAITSFVDASNVYGSDIRKQRELRDEFTGFLLKTEFDFPSHMRRLANNISDDTCILTVPGQQCSRAGDLRVNENPSLTTLHFLFVLEHNRIASILKKFYADPEIIFQETRRIVIAIMQKIIYDEYLPAVISPRGMLHFQLATSAPYRYEPHTDPTMINAFGSAFRFGHSQIPQQMKLVSRDLKLKIPKDFSMNTEDTYFNPDLTYAPFGYERLANYLSASKAPKRDHIIEEAARSRLFMNRRDGTTFDLNALSIQRGRDHGLPPYNEYRKWCGLTPIHKVWNKNGGDSGLTDHSPHLRELLKRAGYGSPQDIDIFPGGMSELSLKGGSLGPTFECLIGEQFRRMKFGDRFWFQNIDAGFNEFQIAAIRRYSLSKVLCNNYNFFRINYPSVFKVSDKPIPCGDIPDLDLPAFFPRK